MSKQALSTATVVATVDALIEKRITWETGTYKAANDELYALLSDCLELFQEVQKERKLIKRINALLDEREIQMRSNTSLATKIVRLIFGDCGKRAYTYAKVITVAAAEKPAKQSMHTFIANAGGVEEVRRNNPDKVNASVQRTERKQYAETVLDVRKPIVSTKIEMTDELEPSNDSVLPLSIALVRRNRDGSGSIVFGTANQTVLNKVLEIAGKQLKEIEDAVKASDARSEQLEERAAILEAA